MVTKFLLEGIIYKDSGKSYHGKSLKNAIGYLTNAEKTQGGRLVESLNYPVATKGYSFRIV